MYKIIKDGEYIGMTDAPVYIKQADNGCLVLCRSSEATGVVIASVPYTLVGKTPIEGTDTIMLEPADAGTELAYTEAALSDADAINVDHEYRLTLLELGITEEV